MSKRYYKFSDLLLDYRNNRVKSYYNIVFHYGQTKTKSGEFVGVWELEDGTQTLCFKLNSGQKSVVTHLAMDKGDIEIWT